MRVLEVVLEDLRRVGGVLLLSSGTSGSAERRPLPARRMLLACGGLERDGKLCGENGRRAGARERRARRPAAAHLHRLMPDVRQIFLIAPLRHLSLKFMRTSKNICTKIKRK